MPIIHIFGASGAGTSSLGDAFHEQYHYTQLDTDDYFWLPTNPPFIKKRSAEDRISLMDQDIKQADKIVISGSLCGWGDVLVPRFDLVIRLVVSADVRMTRLQQREYQRFGERICFGGDMYDEHQKFLQWASEYDNGDRSMRSKAMHDEWQAKITCQKIVLDGTLPMNILIDEISNHFTL